MTKSIHSPIAHWKLDEINEGIAKDSTSNGYHGIYINSPVLGVAGAFGNSKAVTFSGSTQQIMTADISSAILTSGSMSAWFQDGSGSNNANRIIKLYIDSNNWIMIYFSANTTIGAYMRVISSSNNFTTSLKTGITQNTWYHIVATWTPTELAFYVNGIKIGNTISVTVSPSSFTNAVIAFDGANKSGYFTGIVDDFRIYDFALTASEVLKLYNLTDILSDIFINNIYDTRIPTSVCTITSPNYIFQSNNIGNVNITGISNKLIGADGQHFYRPANP